MKRSGTKGSGATPIAMDRLSQYGPILALLLVLFLTSSLGMVAADWADSLGYISTIALLGVIAGAALGRSRFSPSVAVVLASIYGVFLIGLQLGRSLDQALVWRDRILAMLSRIGVFISVITKNEPNHDTLMFVLLMAILYWALACYSGWALLRRSGYWSLILPAGLVLLINAYAYVGPAKLHIYLAFYIIVALFLAVWLDLGLRWRGWRARRAHIPANAEYQLAWPGIIAAVVLVGVAWSLPSFSRSESLSTVWKVITEPTDGTSDRLGNLVANLRAGVAIGISSYYGEELSLGAGVEPMDVLILEVTPLGRPSLGGRFYWRSRTYDTYQDGTWTSSPAEEIRFNPQEGDIDLAGYAYRESVNVLMAPQMAVTRQLQAPSLPIWVARSADVTVITTAQGIVDVLEINARKTVHLGEEYRARASIAVPSAEVLRRAGEAYPDWVAQRYLALPETITERTKALAESLAGDYENNFDKVVAITSWLRENISYSRVTDPPPDGQDPVDWLLFDYKVGFCNYYASAEVVMLRHLGIPARMAAGYARGTYDSERGLYVVRGEDSHAWPEVFFPGVGWVEFEPTVSQDPIIRPEGSEVLDDNQGFTGGPGDTLSDEDRLDRLEDDLRLEDELEGAGAGNGARARALLLRVVIVVGAAVVLLTVLWFQVDVSAKLNALSAVSRGLRRIGFRPPKAIHRIQARTLTPAGSIYAQWSSWLPRLGAVITPFQTPYERATRFAEVFPAGAAAGEQIAESYVRERFGDFKPDENSLRKTWLSLFALLVKRWVWRMVSILFVKREPQV